MPTLPSADVSASASEQRIVLLTVVPALALMLDGLLAGSGFRLVAVVPPGLPRSHEARAAYSWEGFQALMEHLPEGVDVLVPSGRARLPALLAPLKADVLLSYMFPWRLAPEVLSLPRLGALNAHPSLLPRHRGPNPLGWTLRNGEPRVGLTFHRMEARFDTGALLAQDSLPLEDDDALEEVYVKVAQLTRTLLPAALERLAAGEAGESQCEEEATYAGLFEDADLEVDWLRPAREVHNLVRACLINNSRGGLQGARATLEGERVRLLRTRWTEAPATAAPGSVLARDGARRLVQCGSGALWVERAAPL